MSKRMSAAGRRSTIWAAVALGCGLVIGVVLWVVTGNAALGLSVGVALGLLFSGSAAVAGRSRR